MLGETAPCPDCDQEVPVTNLYRWPDGDQRVLQNHGDDRDETPTVIRCDGSLKPVP